MFCTVLQRDTGCMLGLVDLVGLPWVVFQVVLRRAILRTRNSEDRHDVMDWRNVYITSQKEYVDDTALDNLSMKVAMIAQLMITSAITSVPLHSRCI